MLRDAKGAPSGKPYMQQARWIGSSLFKSRAMREDLWHGRLTEDMLARMSKAEILDAEKGSKAKEKAPPSLQQQLSEKLDESQSSTLAASAKDTDEEDVRYEFKYGSYVPVGSMSSGVSMRD